MNNAANTATLAEIEALADDYRNAFDDAVAGRESKKTCDDIWFIYTRLCRTIALRSDDCPWAV